MALLTGTVTDSGVYIIVYAGLPRKLDAIELTSETELLLGLGVGICVVCFRGLLVGLFVGFGL